MPVYKDKERGTWYFEFRKVINGRSIKKKGRGYKTKVEAQAAEYQTIQDLQNPDETQIETTTYITLDMIYQEYYKYRQTKIKIGTLNGEDEKYRNHIGKPLGDYPIREITSKKITKWRQDLVAKNMTEKFTNQIISVFRNLLRFAVKKGYLSNSKIIDELESASMDQIASEREVWTFEEINQFLDSFDLENELDLLYYRYFYCYSRSGMRPNEFRALTVADIKGNYLNVNKNLNSKVKGKRNIVQSPKNKHSIRKVLMGDDVIAMLKEQTCGYKPNDYIFGKDEPMSESTMTKVLNRHIQKANLKPIVLYGFRHSHVTNLIRSGVPIKVVSKRIGHKDVSTTMNVYWHLFAEDEELALEALK